MRLAEKDLAQSGYPYFVSVGGANRVNMMGLLTLGWRSAGQVQPLGRVTTRARAGHSLSRTLVRQRVLWRFNWTRLLASAGQRHPFRPVPDAESFGRLPGAIGVRGRRRAQPVIDVDGRDVTTGGDGEPDECRGICAARQAADDRRADGRERRSPEQIGDHDRIGVRDRTTGACACGRPARTSWT